MPYRIKGTLKLPDGAPAANAELEFISRRNFSPLLKESKSNVLCSAAGAYDVTLEYGEYAVVLYPGGTYPAALGAIVLAADTVTGQDLPTLLQQAGWQPATPEYIQQIAGWLAQANSSASAAKVSETNAAASANSAASTLANVVPKTRTVNGKALTGDITLSAADVGALPITGGTLTGPLIVKGMGTQALTLDGTNAAGCLVIGRKDGVDDWYVGRGNAAGDVVLHSYKHSTSLVMKSDSINFNRDLYVNANKVYHQGFKPTAADIQNVVSPVSAGGIIERGSNANGEYVKFADGTMICTGTVTVAANTYTSAWTFPVAFSATPMCHSLAVGAASGTDKGAFVNEHSSTSSTSLTVKTLLVQVGAINQISSNIGSRVTAIGSWK